MSDAIVLMERHNAGDGVYVELLYTAGHVVAIRLTDPLGTETAEVPDNALALDFFHHPYALAFPGRNPWERIGLDADDPWLNADEVADDMAGASA